MGGYIRSTTLISAPQKSTAAIIQSVITALCVPVRERTRSTCTGTQQVSRSTRAHHVAVPLHHQHKAETKGHTSEL